MKITLLRSLALVSVLSIPGLAMSGAGHSDSHSAAGKTPQSDMEMSEMSMTNGEIEETKKQAMDHVKMMLDMQNSGHDGMGGHAHASWVEPPEAYAQMNFDQWDSFDQANEGMAIYRDQCLMCHGVDGRGTGPLAKSLEHPPADLTSHFHQPKNKGDQYLFWRVTEGGSAEPFASAKSAMPAFKNLLTESQRWSVLSYIHQAFHS